MPVGFPATLSGVERRLLKAMFTIDDARVALHMAKDLLDEPCKRTDRREVCLGLRDFHDMYARHGWGRTITKEEALAILDQSEKDGLVLRPSNEQEPQFICACCGCCCGVLEMMRIMSRPADFAASNFYAKLDIEEASPSVIA